MKQLKIAVMGAGSTYTPELVNGFVTRNKSLCIDSLYLMDIDEEKLNIVGSLIRRIFLANGMQTKVVFTGSVREAVEGADYVIGQIRVGRLPARITDEKIPLKYGLLGQETTGAGGFMKGMRTIPVILDIARQMEQLCPNAFFINFSNPSGMVAQAVSDASAIKIIGLCNGPVNMLRGVSRLLGGETFDYDFVGLNHLCFITGLYQNGTDILKERLSDAAAMETLKNIPGATYSEDLMKAVGAIPIGYLNYYYFREEQIEHCQREEKTRGEVCREIESELLTLYQNPELKEKPSLLDKRGGALYSEAAVSLIDSIETDKQDFHVLDVKNNGVIDYLQRDDIVEVKCRVGKNGAVPMPVRNQGGEYIRGLVSAVKAYERLSVKAALTGDYDSALAALLVHPLIGDYHKAKPLLDEMLAENKEFLPQFGGVV